VIVEALNPLVNVVDQYIRAISDIFSVRKLEVDSKTLDDRSKYMSTILMCVNPRRTTNPVRELSGLLGHTVDDDTHVLWVRTRFLLVLAELSPLVSSLLEMNLPPS
jgi:hypothetical protein